MPKVQRSPPPATSAQYGSSESDVLIGEEKMTESVTRRQKRRRDSPGTTEEIGQLKEDMLAMLTKWKTDQDNTLKKLCTNMAEMKTELTKITKSHEEILKSVEFMAQQYDDMKSKVESLEEERKQQTEYVEVLENKIEDLMKQQKSTQIEIRNIPLLQLKSKVELSEFVVECCKKLDITIDSSDIKDIYKFKDKTGNYTIISDFNSVITKDTIINAIRNYNKKNPDNKFNSSVLECDGPPVPIYIGESLTNKSRRLLFLARGVANACEYKFCWTVRGRVFLRKDTGLPPIEIRSEAQLQVLKGSEQ